MKINQHHQNQKPIKRKKVKKIINIIISNWESSFSINGSDLFPSIEISTMGISMRQKIEQLMGITAKSRIQRQLGKWDGKEKVRGEKNCTLSLWDSGFRLWFELAGLRATAAVPGGARRESGGGKDGGCG
ncbi:hypothetical protein Droror1_Dr00007882 [Drosera rotundifolia]